MPVSRCTAGLLMSSGLGSGEFGTWSLHSEPFAASPRPDRAAAREGSRFGPASAKAWRTLGTSSRRARRPKGRVRKGVLWCTGARPSVSLMTTAELERAGGGALGRRATDRPGLLRRVPCLPGCDEVVGAGAAADLFPSVRRSDDSPAALAGRRMPEFDAHASPTTWIVGQGLKLLDPAERQGIVEGWRAHRRGCWPSLVVDGGCDVRIGTRVVTDRVRTLLLEWLPLAPGDLAVYEGGLFRRSPADALTLLVRPPAIWSIDEAVAAGRLTPRGRPVRPGGVRGGRASRPEATSRRAAHPSSRSRVQDRGAAPARRVPGRECHRRGRVRRDRSRRRIVRSDRGPTARSLCRERPRRPRGGPGRPPRRPAFGTSHRLLL